MYPNSEAMTDQLRASIEKQAEERYGLKEPNYTAQSMRSKTRQEAYIAGATEFADLWKNKLETIRKEIEQRRHKHYFSDESPRIHIDECTAMLSIIDKHLKE